MQSFLIMNRQIICPAARKLVRSSIPSVAHLEALVLLCSAHQWWTGEELAKRLYIDHHECERILRDLYLSGLLSVEQNDDGPRYRYFPPSDRVHASVKRLLETHAVNLRGVTLLIHANASRYQRWWARVISQYQSRHDRHANIRKNIRADSIERDERKGCSTVQEIPC
jgi:predicted transcriptional regulator